MEITYNNCMLGTNEELIIQDGHISHVKLNIKDVPIEDLPRLSSAVNTCLYVLNYGLKTFVIYKDMNNNLEYSYIYEQVLNGNNISIVDYKYTVVIPKENILADIITPVYSKTFEEKGLEQLENLLQVLSYALVPTKVVEQIRDLLLVKQTEDKVSLLEKETKNTEDKIKRLEEASEKDLSILQKFKQSFRPEPSKTKKKTKVNNTVMYKGKTLKQWCNELGLKYKTVYNRIHALNYTIEQALGLEPPPPRTQPDSISGICRAENIDPLKVFARMNRGASFEDAIEAVKNKPANRQEIYEGKTLTELSKEYDIPYATLYSRIYQQHLAPEDAIKKDFYEKKGKED